MAEVVYRYTGMAIRGYAPDETGEKAGEPIYAPTGTYEGIPARDLTDEDWERLPDEKRGIVQESPLYAASGRRQRPPEPPASDGGEG